jgi:hypothetical protein
LQIFVFWGQAATLFGAVYAMAPRRGVIVVTRQHFDAGIRRSNVRRCFWLWSLDAARYSSVKLSNRRRSRRAARGRIEHYARARDREAPRVGALAILTLLNSDAYKTIL